jgi:curved DNA-binding protein
MDYKDYYEILGVSRDVDDKELKSAFRRLARKYHPDVNPNDPEAEERFKEINEAYEVLSDPEKRQKYDRLGSEWQQYQQAGGQPGDFDWGRWQSSAPGSQGQRVHVQYGTPEDLEDLFGGGSPFSDFFGQIFGGVGGGRQSGGFDYQPRPQQGQDYEQEIEITLLEAYQGTERLFEKDGRRLRVKIPAGARTGTRVRLAGEGGAGTAGGSEGDLYLRVRVAPDPRFEREGDDLHATVSLDLYTAVLGGKTTVPTLDGAVRLSVPEDTQNGQVFRLRGKGMPKLRQPKEHGDLYARMEVQLPTDLSAEQRDLFRQLQHMSEKGG